MNHDPHKTALSCCPNRHLIPSLFMPVQIGSPLAPQGAGIGVVQAICTSCLTEWGIFSTEEGFLILRAKTAKELAVL